MTATCPVAQDPYLSNLDSKQIDYVKAGQALYQYYYWKDISTFLAAEHLFAYKKLGDPELVEFQKKWFRKFLLKFRAQ